MEDSARELASCVCNYAQVRGCRAVCLGLGFEARKEGREKGGGGESRKREKKERSSEARENLVILRTAASLMDSVCVFREGGGVGQQERAVFIQSVPCLYHVVGKTTGRLPV